MMPPALQKPVLVRIRAVQCHHQGQLLAAVPCSGHVNPVGNHFTGLREPIVPVMISGQAHQRIAAAFERRHEPRGMADGRREIEADHFAPAR
jgi:hypothetical protein